MYQNQTKHPVSRTLDMTQSDVLESMFRLFEQIGVFWKNMGDAEQYRSRLYSFMENRINLGPIYREYYIMAKVTLDELIAEHGEQKAYEFLFTNNDINQAPAVTPLAITRQKVSNEFVSLQVSLVGFKAFGAENYPGYIGGAFIPFKQIPYRTWED